LLEAVLLKDISRSRISQHMVCIEPIETEDFKYILHYHLYNFGHVAFSPSFNHQPETQLSLRMLTVNIANLNQATDTPIHLLFYSECDGASSFLLCLLPGNVPLGFSSRIRMREGYHGIGDLSGAGCILN